MALITNATTDWSAPVTLTEEEVWQARRGSVYVTTTSSPSTTMLRKWALTQPCSNHPVP